MHISQLEDKREKDKKKTKRKEKTKRQKLEETENFHLQNNTFPGWYSMKRLLVYMCDIYTWTQNFIDLDFHVTAFTFPRLVTSVPYNHLWSLVYSPIWGTSYLRPFLCCRASIVDAAPAAASARLFSTSFTLKWAAMVNSLLTAIFSLLLAFLYFLLDHLFVCIFLLFLLIFSADFCLC